MERIWSSSFDGYVTIYVQGGKIVKVDRALEEDGVEELYSNIELDTIQ